VLNLKDINYLYSYFKKIVTSVVLLPLKKLGMFFIFTGKVFKTLLRQGVEQKLFIKQLDQLGVKSITICVITGCFSGAVMAIQSYRGFQKFGGQHLIGVVVALTLVRELGPVLTGLMVAGRVGAGIASEIGSMKVTEQIDALETLHVHPINFLIIPRILATVLALPCLTLLAVTFGIMGGYLVSVKILCINGQQFLQSIREYLSFYDLFGCLLKAVVFGALISLIATYNGYFCHGGAKGVGSITTQTVVRSSILIIIVNYFLALLIFGPH
jgi:phospholipid/cholesterol/gamma-HCH transport system permease protein